MINPRRKFCIVILAVCFSVIMLSGFMIRNTWTDNQNKAHQIAELARELGLPEDDAIIVRAQEIWWREEIQQETVVDGVITAAEPSPVAEIPVVDTEDTPDTVEIPEVRVEDVVKEISTTTAEAAVLADPQPTKYTLGVPGYTQEDIDRVASVVYNEAGNNTERRHKELVAACVVNRVNSPWLGDTIYEVITWPNQYLPAYAQYGSYYMNRAMDAENWEECKEIAEKALKGEIDCPYDVIFQAEFIQGRGIYEKFYTPYGPTYFCYSLYSFDDPLATAQTNVQVG